LAAKPWRVEAAEGGADAGLAADLALAGATPTEDNAYKLPLARRTLKATLVQVAEVRP
jgi:xanthine dehydrogenase YagS FAD-binding subunit